MWYYMGTWVFQLVTVNVRPMHTLHYEMGSSRKGCMFMNEHVSGVYKVVMDIGWRFDEEQSYGCKWKLQGDGMGTEEGIWPNNKHVNKASIWEEGNLMEV